MTSSQHGPYALGYTHATMAGTMGCEGASRSQSHQSRPQLGLLAIPRSCRRVAACNPNWGRLWWDWLQLALSQPLSLVIFSSETASHKEAVPQRAQPLSLVIFSSETASHKEEEGGDDVKSSWP